MTGEVEKAEEKKDDGSGLLRNPPPSTHTTKKNRTFEFGRPSLKHRKIIMKVLRIMKEPAADYNAIIECAKARKMSVDDLCKLDEKEYTDAEKRAIMKRSTLGDNLEFADSMNDILTEVLYATVKKAPFIYTTLEEFENKMDDYAEAVELFPIAVKWIALSAAEIGTIDRKNL